LAWLGGIERTIGAARVARDTAGRGQLRVVVRSVPIADPLPHVAGDVVKPVPVRRKLRHRRETDVRVLARVLVREMSLMTVRHPCSVRPEGVAPRIDVSGETAAGGEFPLGLCWNPFAPRPC